MFEGLCGLIMKPSNKDKHKHKIQIKQTEEGKMKRTFKNSKKGFSLVEMICVIAIIVILAAAIGFNYIHVFRNAIEALGSI